MLPCAVKAASQSLKTFLRRLVVMVMNMVFCYHVNEMGQYLEDTIKSRMGKKMYLKCKTDKWIIK